MRAIRGKIFKIVGIAGFSCVCFYAVQKWQLFGDNFSVEPKGVALVQQKLDIKPIESLSKSPLWYVRTENPTVAFTIVFKNEGKRNFKDQPGILELIDNTLMDGAGNYDSSTLKQMFIDNNINISINFTDDNAVVSVYTVSKSFSLAVDLLSDILTKAHFTSDKIEVNKQSMLVGCQQSKFSSMQLALDAMQKEIYPDSHPYNISIDDMINNIPKYTKKDIEASYSQLFTADNAIVTIAGSVSEDLVQKEFAKLLSNLATCKKNDFKDVVQKTEIKNIGKVKHVELDTSQTSICFVLPGILKSDSDRFAVKLANTVFGGREAIFQTKLFKKVREERGLVYSIVTTVVENDMQSVVLGQSSLSAENVKTAVELIKSECKDFAEKGITQEELDYYKTAISSRQTIQSAQDIVGFINRCRMDLIQLKYINNYLSNYYSLTLDEVNKAIKRIFVADKMTFITSGKSLSASKKGE